MDIILRVQMYVITAIMLLIILTQHAREEKYYYIQNRLFRILVISSMVAISLETLGWLLHDHFQIFWPQFIGLANIVLLLLYLLPILFWCLYVDFEVYAKIQRFKWILLVYFIIVVINGVYILANPEQLHFFNISDNSLLQRGNWPFLLTLTCILLFSFTLWFVIKNWKAIYWRNRWSLVFFSIFPLVTLLIQVFFDKITLFWGSFSLALLVIYITVQNKAAKTDYLTGFYNRRHLESFLETKIRNMQRDDSLALIIIDLYELSYINEQYGYLSGDRAIEAIATLIRSVFERRDIIARFSGHEFVILSNINNEQLLEKKFAELREHLTLFNDKKREPFEIRIKTGFQIITQVSKLKAPDLLDYLRKQLPS